MPACAILGAGGLTAGSSLISGVIGSSAAQSAAKTQAAAADNAAQLQYLAETQSLNLQRGEFNVVSQNLQPYLGLGKTGLNDLTKALPGITGEINAATRTANNAVLPLTAPPTNLAALARTPGYQFALQQGKIATQDSYAAQGLSGSGAELKGASTFAENQAATTYNMVYQNYLAQNQLRQNQSNLNLSKAGTQAAMGANLYNIYNNMVQTGAQAATRQGQFGTSLAQSEGQTATTSANAIANSLTGAAAASAAGTVGSANAITNALGGISGAGANTALMLALNNAGMFGSASNAANSAMAGNPLGLTGTQDTGLPF